MRIEQKILANLLLNDEYLRKVSPFLKPNYWDDNIESIIIGVILDYFNAYNERPTVDIINVELSKVILNSKDLNESIEYINNLGIENATEYDWLIDNTEKFCQEKSIHNALVESINIHDDGDKNKLNTIPAILQKALSVSFENNIGHDYIDESDDRFAEYHKYEDKISFDIDKFNDITNGGLSNKTLNILIAGTGVGKTLCMTHFASSALKQGRNVLYITLEMSEIRIAERIDVNLFDIDMKDLRTLERPRFDDYINSIKKKTIGKIIIKEYPTSQGSAGHFRALLDELKKKKSFTPDLIFVDYLNICSSVRVRENGNSYMYVKSIAEEIRGLAVEVDVPIITATQMNREGFKHSDPDLTNTSESFGIPATADFMVAISNDESNDNKIIVKQLKNRYGDICMNKKFKVGVDRDKMKLYNVDDDDYAPSPIKTANSTPEKISTNRFNFEE